MTKHCLTRVGVDVFINFYEVASIESQGDNDVLIVLKNGHKIELENTAPSEVNFRLAAHVAYISEQTNDAANYGGMSYRAALDDGYRNVRKKSNTDEACQRMRWENTAASKGGFAAGYLDEGF